MDNYTRRAIFYDIEYDTQEDFPFISRILNGTKKRVLEIPCGAGRTFDLHKTLQNDVTFADIEDKMVEKVSNRIKEANLQDRFNCIKADIMNFSINEKFDIILIFKEAFQLFQPKQAMHALKSVKEHLAVNGKIFIDIYDFSSKNVNEHKEPEYFDKSKKKKRIVLDNNNYVIRTTKNEFKNNILTVNYSYVLYKQESITDTFESIFTLYNWSEPELAIFFNNVGLCIQNRYSNYEDENYCSNSPRTILELK